MLSYRRPPTELPALLAQWKGELRTLDAAADPTAIEKPEDRARAGMARDRAANTLGSTAAMLAAVCHGEHPDIASAAAAMVRLGRRFQPDPARSAVYERSFRLYNTLYGALAPVFRKFSGAAKE